MNEAQSRPSLDDVDTPSERVRPDHLEHAKTPHPLDDDALEARTQRERDKTGADGPLTSH
jgi:hypothetical protein